MNLKNTLKRTLVAALAVVLMFSVIPFASTAESSNIQKIFDFLTGSMGLNSASACGVLANIEYESNFDPNCVGDSGSSYGICQWHAERYTNLKNYCAKNGYSYKSLDGQLNFLKYELSSKEFKSILSKISSVANTADGAYTAGYNWCYYFERPANKAAQSEKRGTRAKNYYWPKYQVADVKYGDINGDGKINSSDALLLVEYSVGSRSLSDKQLKAADLNKDGKITSSDAFIILSMATGNTGASGK